MSERAVTALGMIVSGAPRLATAELATTPVGLARGFLAPLHHRRREGREDEGQLAIRTLRASLQLLQTCPQLGGPLIEGGAVSAWGTELRRCTPEQLAEVPPLSLRPRQRPTI